MQLSTVPSPGTELIEAVPGPAPERTSERRASRWWLAAAFAVALAAFVPDAFGRQVFDTKIDLTVDPFTFLHNIVYLWNPNGWFGSLRNQYQGFAFPTAPFFIVGHIVDLPPWLVERIWMATAVTVGFWGVVRLAEELRIGTPASRLVAGAAFALWPVVTMQVGADTAEVAAGVLIAWATIPLVRASRSGAPIRGAALSAVAVLFMGGNNAAVTLYALIIPGIFLLTRQTSPRKRSLISWWVVCVVLATSWWAIPLLFQGRYGFNFQPYVEQSITTTSTSSATTALSGTGLWTAYVNLDGAGWDQAALTIVSLSVVILGAGLAAAAGLYGIASREMRERRFLVASLAVTAVGAMAAYWGPLGGPGSHLLLPIMNGVLAPFRSVHKLEPAIGLVLALGIAHTLQKMSQWERSRWRTRRARRVTSRVIVGFVIAAVLVSLATPYLMGRAVNKDSYAAIPSYWYKVADYLHRNSPMNTALVVPAASHGEYVWGWSEDQPLEALARSPWANDQNTPFGSVGSVRMVDAIESDLRTGHTSSGLPELLSRSGIKYVVVQNDLQWQLSDSPSPFEVHQVLEGSGLTSVASFGPTIETATTDYPTLTLDNSGPHVPYPAVEIFQATHATNSPVATYPASSAALVSGGPEAIQQLLDNGVLGKNQAAILATDWNGAYRGPLFAVTDTLRRDDVNFGLVNDNTSYTYTATGTTPDQTGIPDVPAQPNQLLPAGVQHQTVAVLKGAKSITVSSAGSEFFSLPEYNPANVFDGESSSGWITGSPFGPRGEWIQINFNHPVNPRGTHIQFLVGNNHALVTGVRVSTDRGSIVTRVSPTSGSQLVKVPAGTARYLRVTFVSLAGPNSTSGSAGIQTISIPGVHVRLFLKPPQESTGANAKHLALSFQTTPVDGNDLLRQPVEPVMARQFSTPRRMSMSITGWAIPRPSTALDSVLGNSKLTITASSLGNLPQFRPQNLIDGNSTTSWIAGTSHPSIKMTWPKATMLSSFVITDSHTAFAAAPREVLISSSAGNRLVNVGTKTFGTFTFAPLKTNSVTVSFPKVQTHLIRSGLNKGEQAPVGLAEFRFPKLLAYRTVAPNPAAHFSEPCGFGPPIYIDGTKYETSIGPVAGGASPTVGDLLALNPVSLTICSPHESATMARGQHELVTTPTGMPFNISTLTIKQVGTPTAGKSVDRQARVVSWGQESRDLAITSGPASYLEVHQNFSSGWTATLDGKTLAPIRLDGWQQGYLVPAGGGGTVHLTFAPEQTYVLGLILSALGVILLVLIALGLGRRRGLSLEPSPPWTRPVPLWLSIGLAACVLFVVGGPIVLAVPLLVFVGSRRASWLPWVALVGMTVAGTIAAINPGSGALSHNGAFSAPAQIFALIALAAVLVPIVDRRFGKRKRDKSVDELRDSVDESRDSDYALVGVAGDGRENEDGAAGNGGRSNGGR